MSAHESPYECPLHYSCGGECRYDAPAPAVPVGVQPEATTSVGHPCTCGLWAGYTVSVPTPELLAKSEDQRARQARTVARFQEVYDQLAARIEAEQMPDGEHLSRERVEVFNMGLRRAAAIVRGSRIGLAPPEWLRSAYRAFGGDHE